jgi:hypothetical protein
MFKMIYLIRSIIWGAPSKTLLVPEKIWVQTWLGLRKRGRGKVESAAIWGGRREGSTEIVEAVYFLDDLAAHIQFSGYHKIPARALAELFNKLRQDRRVIVGDIHTHPSDWVGLSGLDKTNPIEFRKGIYAMVLPSYALPEPSLKSAGVHEYMGNGRWRELSQKAKKKYFKFT